jgi:hypothetical protein
MTNLSPQAQAILDAYDSAPFVDYDIGDRVSIAAVLRALVSQLKYDQSCWDEPVEHMVLDTRAILDVADELEAL